MPSFTTERGKAIAARLCDVGRVAGSNRAHHGNCIAGTWESRYTDPETGKVINERGAELFFLRGDKVYEHHMWQHSWAEGEVLDDKGFSTA
jgi:hypothetical protein